MSSHCGAVDSPAKGATKAAERTKAAADLDIDCEKTEKKISAKSSICGSDDATQSSCIMSLDSIMNSMSDGSRPRAFLSPPPAPLGFHWQCE